jgi:FADH2 O2-dependent halogenase
MNTADDTYDVVILGTGLPGSALAAILARHGARVALIGAGTHPRPAFEETAIPYTSLLFRVLGERYDVPELGRLAGWRSIRENVTRNCGIGRTLGFVYHRAEGRLPEPADAGQIASPRLLPAEATLFRQDIDAYVFYTAIGYGATARQQATVSEINAGADGVTVVTGRGETWRARYLVDATGRESPLAEQVGLREEPPRLRHRSRTVATHMVNVRPFDEVAGHRYPAPQRWDQGTLHHLFDGGYLWITPFGNHRDAPNQVTSVGASLDPDRHPAGDDPEAQLRALADRIPPVAEQLAGARAVQPWTSTPPRQYAAAPVTGERWCLLADSVGYVDPFLSRSLVTGLESVNAFAWRLLAAVGDGDFAAERLQPIGRFQDQLTDGTDQLASMVFAALRDPLLWKSVLRIWEIGSLYGTMQLQDAFGRLQATGSDAALRDLENAKYLGSPFPTHDGYNELLAAAAAECAAVSAGETQPGTAGSRIFARLAGADFVPPALGLADPTTRHYHPTPLRMARFVAWSRRTAPADIGSLVGSALPGLARPRRRSRKLREEQ